MAKSVTQTAVAMRVQSPAAALAQHLSTRDACSMNHAATMNLYIQCHPISSHKACSISKL